MQLSKVSLLGRLRDALRVFRQDNPSCYGWRISLGYSQSRQSLLLGDEKAGFRSYQEREVKDLSYHIEIYTRYGTPQQMGVSSNSIDPEAPLGDQIKKTFDNALLSGNPPWDLPQPSDKPFVDVQTADPAIIENITREHQRLFSAACAKAKNTTGVKINSGELFTSLHSKYFETSTGIIGEKKTSDIYFEIALEKLPLPNDQEVLKYKKAISVEEADLATFIQETVEETLSIQDSQMPLTQNSATILVDTQTISDFFHTLLDQLYADNEYRKSPHLKADDLIYSGDKDPQSDTVRLTLDPTLPVMAASSPFTGEGLPTEKAVVIENDVVQHQLISTRMACYLNKVANGIRGNVVIEPGSKTKAELLVSQPQCIEIISFASLLLNPSTLTWSSEIKLGKLHEQGKAPKIVKGGVVSGNLKENLRNFSFSQKLTAKNAVADTFGAAQGYYGPDAMLIRSGVKIAGA